MLSFSTGVDRTLISLLGAVVTASVLNGLITEYYQAFTLLMLPLGIFGMAVSTAAFPTMAENVARGRLDRVRTTILETLRNIIFLSIPASIGLIVLGLTAIQVLLQHGAYTLADAEATAVPLACFAFGLAGLAAVEILTRAFYALRDSVTPVIVSVGQFIFKIALSLLLIDLAVFGAQWGTGALALSTSIAGTIEAVILIWLLHKRLGGLQLRTLVLFIGRVLVASAVMGVGLFIVRVILDLILSTNHDSLGFGDTLLAAIKLFIEMLVGVFIYIRAARMLHIEEVQKFLETGPVRRLLNRFKLTWG
ncbi:MAG: polysaccharide biosynthesis C-terminal domain-containing protein, partial [Chloroflexota bacterium]|nr:polysaccharide biosynthesis C-terminal domain-containing protein [Chloroflexota bacterium]